jgi:hypothetical protein
MRVNHLSKLHCYRPFLQLLRLTLVMFLLYLSQLSDSKVTFKLSHIGCIK